MIASTAFTVADAVDVWDAEFRWRDAERLRDLTIEDTWRRVADQAASVEVVQGALWSFRFIDCFSHWRLLPDENILRHLGTHRPLPAFAEPSAVLNVAAFVIKQPVAGVRFDRERFVAVASWAVRLLDDVMLAIGVAPPPQRLRIGLIGLANALQALDLDYDSERGRQHGGVIARALAEGCLRGSVELAEERGRRVSMEDCLARVEQMRNRRMPEWLIERAVRIGLCHDALTALDPHPSLARLANGVADTAEPLLPADIGGNTQQCELGSAPELEMRAVLQPFIDEPMLCRSNRPCTSHASPNVAPAVPRASAPTAADRPRK